MAKKILDLSVLSSFLDNLKETFSLLTHKHSVIDIEDYVVDSTFSATSTNPVQNKTVNNALLTIASDLDEIDAKLDTIEEGANKTVVDSELSATSTNPVENKAVQTAIQNLEDSKADVSDIPTKVSDLANDSGFITEQYVDSAISNIDIDITVDSALSSTSENPVQNKVVQAAIQTLTDSKADKTSIPTKVSDLTNDSNFTTTSAVTSSINTHNTNTSAHNDIRLSLSELSTKVNNFLNVNDTTKDQLSEIIALIEANADDIESITSGKVNVADIINNLTTNVSNKPLSAAQGVVLKGLIDTINSSLSGYDSRITTNATNLTTHENSSTAHNISGQIQTAKNDCITNLVSNGKSLTLTKGDGTSATLSLQAAEIADATLTVSGWTTTAPYTQAITITGVSDDETLTIQCLIENTTKDAKKAVEKAWGYVDDIETIENAIVATCYFDKPTVDIPLVIKR